MFIRLQNEQAKFTSAKAAGANVVWYMNGAAIAGQDVLYTVADLNWRIVIH